MTHSHKYKSPRIDSWYQAKSLPEIFRVVALDNDLVEIQYLDGDIEELDKESWLAIHPLEIPGPEDAAAGYEPLDREDVIELYSESDAEPLRANSYSNFINESDRI